MQISSDILESIAPMAVRSIEVRDFARMLARR
jgi:hypothetical protein